MTSSVSPTPLARYGCQTGRLLIHHFQTSFFFPHHFQNMSTENVLLFSWPLYLVLCILLKLHSLAGIPLASVYHWEFCGQVLCLVPSYGIEGASFFPSLQGLCASFLCVGSTFAIHCSTGSTSGEALLGAAGIF